MRFQVKYKHPSGAWRVMALADLNPAPYPHGDSINKMWRDARKRDSVTKGIDLSLLALIQSVAPTMPSGSMPVGIEVPVTPGNSHSPLEKPFYIKSDKGPLVETLIMPMRLD